MRLAKDRNAFWFALAAALVLVVQTFGSAHAAGLGNRPVLLDAFGNPLCITSGEHGGAGDDDTRGALKDCCTLACAGMAVALSPDAVATADPAPRLIAVLCGAEFVPAAAAPFGTPTHPRAPPLAM